MLLKLRLLVVVDEKVCDYKYMKDKLDKLTIEVAQLELVTDNHWGMPVRWFDERWIDYRNGLSRKIRTSTEKSIYSYSQPYHVFTRLPKEVDKKIRKRISRMVKFSDRVVVFWDGFSNLNVERVKDKAEQLGKPCREYLI